MGRVAAELRERVYRANKELAERASWWGRSATSPSSTAGPASS